MYIYPAWYIWVDRSLWFLLTFLRHLSLLILRRPMLFHFLVWSWNFSSFVSLYLYVPDEGSLLPKYRDCTTSNNFELYLMCCGVMLLLLIIYMLIYICIHREKECETEKLLSLFRVIVDTEWLMLVYAGVGRSAVKCDCEIWKKRVGGATWEAHPGDEVRQFYALVRIVCYVCHQRMCGYQPSLFYLPFYFISRAAFLNLFTLA